MFRTVHTLESEIIYHLPIVLLQIIFDYIKRETEKPENNFQTAIYEKNDKSLNTEMEWLSRRSRSGPSALVPLEFKENLLYAVRLNHLEAVKSLLRISPSYYIPSPYSRTYSQ